MVVFGKEAVPGVDAVGIRYFSGTEDGGDIQITLCDIRRPDAYGFIRETHMQGFPVDFRIYRNSFYPEFFAGTDNPYRNFTAVRD
jgi:hypothetical protein